MRKVEIWKCWDPIGKRPVRTARQGVSEEHLDEADLEKVASHLASKGHKTVNQFFGQLMPFLIVHFSH